jgi:hypothetical protein
MTAMTNRGWGIVSMMVMLTVAPAFAEQSPKGADVATAPVPAQILSGKRVFVANAGEENLDTPLGIIFSGKTDRVYNEFYAVMKDWGRYELVSSPADADVIFEIGFSFAQLQAPEMGRLRLDIRDPRSNVLLWTFTDYVQVAIRKGNRDKNLDQSMGVIVGAMKGLVTQGQSPQP